MVVRVRSRRCGPIQPDGQRFCCPHRWLLLQGFDHDAELATRCRPALRFAVRLAVAETAKARRRAEDGDWGITYAGARPAEPSETAAQEVDTPSWRSFPCAAPGAAPKHVFGTGRRQSRGAGPASPDRRCRTRHGLLLSAWASADAASRGCSHRGSLSSPACGRYTVAKYSLCQCVMRPGSAVVHKDRAIH